MKSEQRTAREWFCQLRLKIETFDGTRPIHKLVLFLIFFYLQTNFLTLKSAYVILEYSNIFCAPILFSSWTFQVNTYFIILLFEKFSFRKSYFAAWLIVRIVKGIYPVSWIKKIVHTYTLTTWTTGCWKIKRKNSIEEKMVFVHSSFHKFSL